MLEIVVGIILLPLAVAAITVTAAIGVGIYKGIKEVVKRKK